MIDYGFGVRLGSVDEIPFETLRRWRNDFRIYRYCRQNDLISISDQNKWKEKIASDRTIKMYSVITQSGKGVGVCGLTDLDLLNCNAEFSLYIEPNSQGQGYGKQALQTLICNGFNAYGLEVIWGETFEHNPAAKMFLQVGLKLEGVLRRRYFREGKFIDAHLYSIIRSKWERRAQLCFTQDI